MAQLAQRVPDVKFVIEVMEEEGLDISRQWRTQITPDLVDAADKVIVMAGRDTWPDFLVEGGKVEFWEIQDGVNQPKDFAREIRDQIKAKVEQLVLEIG